jgi:ABC-type multidrug transport system fused ATPase/permease subunit
MKNISGEAVLPTSSDKFIDPVTNLTNTVGFAAQTAWLFNATIRDNILFGETYDPVRYEAVVRACALVTDFETLEGGDLTEIGEKGINLSGGQKQRISLARVCYSRASYVLLDDPLSAVDAPTAKHLLHHCILKLLKGRTVILVTHATSLVLPWSDYVVSMRNGSVLTKGTPAEIVADDKDDTLYGMELFREEFETNDNLLKPLNLSPLNGGTTLIEDEEKASGSVKLSLYKQYLTSAGGLTFTFVCIIFFLIVSGNKLANDWWLKRWTDHNTNLQTNLSMSDFGIASIANMGESNIDKQIGTEFSSYSDLLVKFIVPSTVASTSAESVAPASQSSDALFYVGIYACLGLGVILTTNLQYAWTLYGTYQASINLHNQLLYRVLYSPLRFFEVTPIGRILNRFSKDMESIDTSVMDTLKFFTEKVLDGVTIIAVIGSIVPPFLLVVPFVAFVFGYVSSVYLRCSRELKRFESISRSPIYAQFSETLSGVCTIRAFHAEDRFQEVNVQKINDNHKPFFYVWAANRWLCMRTDLISAIFVFCSGLAAVYGNVGSGWAALLITYALQFTYSLIWVIRMQAEVEMNMNAGMFRLKKWSVLMNI